VVEAAKGAPDRAEEGDPETDRPLFVSVRPQA